MSGESKPLPCPWCGEEPQSIGGGRVAHACRAIDRELRMGEAEWNVRAEPRDGGGPKTATEELRALLDARDAKWYADDSDMLLHTAWRIREGQFASHTEAVGDDARAWLREVKLYNITPAQAVVATLGRRECEVVYDGDLWWKCLGCGERWRQEQGEPGYCPRCGGKAAMAE